ncbi:MAG: PPK2 family polyphosphate:nucleotide phosphotransferase [Candidatus Promineifilaceae bacterium]|jgi:PPK2 family polyphosphate:nucleotide phosphotransferase
MENEMIKIKRAEQHIILPDSTIKLNDISTSAADHYSLTRKTAEDEFNKLRKELAELQFRLYAEGKQKLLVVLQALDAGGKDSTIRKVFRGVNPQGVQVTSFKAPTKEELAHDYLWRIHQHVPAKGMINIFNRSHYEDVLIVRVQNFAPKEVWHKRFDHINQFEKLLADTGTKIIKIYLHISKDEQKERLQERLNNPERNWKFESGDLAQRAKWGEYLEAFEDVFAKCSTEQAPWYVIPADNKWYRNLAVSRILVDTLRQMDPQFPLAEEGLENIVIE